MSKQNSNNTDSIDDEHSHTAADFYQLFESNREGNIHFDERLMALGNAGKSDPQLWRLYSELYEKREKTGILDTVILETLREKAIQKAIDDFKSKSSKCGNDIERGRLISDRLAEITGYVSYRDQRTEAPFDYVVKGYYDERKKENCKLEDTLPVDYISYYFEGVALYREEMYLLDENRKYSGIIMGSEYASALPEAIENEETSTDNRRWTREIALLDYLGILDLIKNKFNHTDTHAGYTKEAKLIHEFTGIPIDSIRKCMEAIYYSNADQKNNPNSPKNLEYVKNVKEKYKI